MSEQRFDFYMMTAEVTYLRDDVPKNRRMNTLIQVPKALIDYGTLESTRQATLERLSQENGITPDQVKDFVVLGVYHLGRCTVAEFRNQEAKPKGYPSPLVDRVRN